MNDDRKFKPMTEAEFYKSLREKYSQLKNGEIEYSEEEESLKKIMSALDEDIEPRYKRLRPIGVGGVGVVLMVEDTNLKTFCALKFPRPVSSQELVYAEIVQSEISRLLEMRHPNIINIFQRGQVEVEKGKQIPYYVMEYIEDATDALEFFLHKLPDVDGLLNILKQVFEGINHLHKMNVVHLDLKLENILIAPDGRSVIADLGSARELTEPSTETTQIVFTRPYAHPDLVRLRHLSASARDPNVVKADVERCNIKKPYDLYALGKNIRRIIDLYAAEEPRVLDAYSQKYLDLLGCRLLDGINEDQETALGLPRIAFESIKYTDVSEVLIDLKKFTGEYPISRFLGEMDQHSVDTIQTASLFPTTLTDRLSELINSPVFQRLAGVSQLGFIILVYPNATHSRLEHTLGTFTNVVRYCDALYNDPINPLFKQIVNEEDLKAIALAALCHDIGQFPLAHDLEEADDKVFSHKKLSHDIILGKLIKQKAAGKQKTVGGQNSDLDKFVELIREQWGIDPARVASIINANPSNLKAPIKDRLFHTLIDGPLDADKLDYLVRDSANLGLPFARVIDYQRLISCLTVVFKEQARKTYIALGIHEKGKISAETVAFARYALFGTVYWQHTVRAAKAMLHRAVWEALTKAKKVQLLREDMIEFIFFNVTEQPERLFDEDEEPDIESTSLLPSDYDMLKWLAKHTDEAGKDLLQMLSKRQIYKRILVISEAKNSRLWQSLTDFRTQNSWKPVVKLQNAIQEGIMDALESEDSAEIQRISTSCSAELDKAFVLNNEGKALILIDIPVSRPAAGVSLEYLPETDRRETREGWKTTCILEDSRIWNELEKYFVESVGKIRVLCHPEIRNIIELAISKEDIEGIVENSVNRLHND